MKSKIKQSDFTGETIQDKIDSRKIYKRLAAGDLEGIYVPQTEMEHVRSLVRERSRIVSDQTRCKNRIWSLLMF